LRNNWSRELEVLQRGGCEVFAKPILDIGINFGVCIRAKGRFQTLDLRGRNVVTLLSQLREFRRGYGQGLPLRNLASRILCPVGLNDLPGPGVELLHRRNICYR